MTTRRKPADPAVEVTCRLTVAQARAFAAMSFVPTSAVDKEIVNAARGALHTMQSAARRAADRGR